MLRHGENGDFRAGSHTTTSYSVFNKGRQTSDFFCSVMKKKYMLAVLLSL